MLRLEATRDGPSRQPLADLFTRGLGRPSGRNPPSAGNHRRRRTESCTRCWHTANGQRTSSGLALTGGGVCAYRVVLGADDNTGDPDVPAELDSDLLALK